MKNTVLLLFLMIGGFLSAQNIDIDKIKTSNNYVWGYGEARTMRKANKEALSMLVTSISVQVKDKYQQRVSEQGGNVEEVVNWSLNTYTSTSLKQTEQRAWEENGNHCVFRYLSKESLAAIFKARAEKVQSYLKTGNSAEAKLRFGDALQNYYWALLLLESHPDKESLKTEIVGADQQLLKTYIPSKIQDLLAKLDINLVSKTIKPEDKSVDINLKATLAGKAVENIDFIYDMGGGEWSPLQSGRDGIMLATRFGEAANSSSRLRIRIEYMYMHRAQTDKEIFAIIDNDEMEFPMVNNSEFVIALSESPKKQAYKKVEIENLSGVENNPVKSDLCMQVKERVPLIIEAMCTKKYATIQSHFTPAGWSVFQKLVEYGNAYPIMDELNLKVKELKESTMLRGLPVKFNFPNSNRSFVEKLVFNFNKEGKVEDISFALSDNAIKHLLQLDSRFGSDEEKFKLIAFMEVYKTSYCLKRLGFIDSLFADEALIIVGNKVKRDYTTPKENIPVFKREDEYEFVRKTKAEYMNSLRRVFNSNEFINLHFEDSRIIRARRDQKVYGIQIAQHYTSTSYADKGYLFLMIDLENTKQPKIYVRSWQPERREDGSIIGVEDFILN